jgi:hypothetical protein
VQRLPVGRAQGAHEFVGHPLTGLVGVAQEGAALLGQDDDAAAAVLRGGPTLGEAQLFQVVDQADDRARVIAEPGAQFPLQGPLGGGEEAQDRVVAQPQSLLLEEGVEELPRAQAQPVQQIARVRVQSAHPRLVRVDGFRSGVLASDGGLPVLGRC